MNRRLRDGQLTVKRPHRLSRNRRKDASDLDIYLERVTVRPSHLVVTCGNGRWLRT